MDRLSDNNGPYVYSWCCLHAKSLADFKPAKTPNSAGSPVLSLPI